MEPKNTVFGIVAHVDAGKTTLSEQLLFSAGAIRTAGRVDKGTSYLDNAHIERSRGITVFSKQAQLTLSGRRFTLLDTPGHSDFSGETERVLSVLDAAILIISAGDGVNGHTLLLKKLLDRYSVPVIIFVNKTDLISFDRAQMLSAIREEVGSFCFEAEKLFPMDGDFDEETAEDIAVLDEGIMEHYLESGTLPDGAVKRLFSEIKLVPVYFGAALKNEGVDELIRGLCALTDEDSGDGGSAVSDGGSSASGGGSDVSADAFSAKVFSIGHEDRRLTYMKLTGGTLKVRDDVVIGETSEKVTELRIYSGEKYRTVSEAHAGDVVAACGLESTYAGQGLGGEADEKKPSLTPVMRVRVLPDSSTDSGEFQRAMSVLSEEEPSLCIMKDEGADGDYYLGVMGALQEEILESVFQERFGIKVSFGPGQTVYAETIRGSAEGAGHYEPLRHYAEVHLLLKEGEPGSGLVIGSSCPTDVLDKTYQRQILDALMGSARAGLLKGVLTGAGLTDIEIILLSGKSHVKHTMPGDFREAALRALRQGLMRAENVLLSPYSSFVMRLPSNLVGKALTDISDMKGTAEPPETLSDGKTAIIRGTLPADLAGDYPLRLSSYSGGEGTIDIEPAGFRPADDPEAIMEEKAYDPDRDISSPSGSIFCSHGAGTFIPWDEVPDHMHLPYMKKSVHPHSGDGFLWSEGWVRAAQLSDDEEEASGFVQGGGPNRGGGEDIVSIMSGLGRSANQKDKPRGRDRDIEKVRRREDELKRRRAAEEKLQPYKGREKVDIKLNDKPALLLVDGYNIIFSWDELKALADINIDSARGRLNELLSNYAGYSGCEVIVVYDAYLLENHATETYAWHNIHVVFTATAETADQYIERAAIKRSKASAVSVATSDRVERVIVLSQGARVLSAESFKAELDSCSAEIEEKLKNI